MVPCAVVFAWIAQGCGDSTDSSPGPAETAGAGGDGASAGSGGSENGGSPEGGEGGVPQSAAGAPSSSCRLEQVPVTLPGAVLPSVPSLASTGEAFGVAWTEQGDARGAWFALLDASGNPVSTRHVADTASAPLLVANEDGYVVLMEDLDVHFARLHADGSVLSNDVEVMDGVSHERRVAVSTEDGLLVNFRSSPCSGNSRGGVTLFDGEGTELRSTVLFAHDGDCSAVGNHPALIGAGDAVGALWIDPLEGFPQLHFTELSASGEFGAATPVRLTSAARTARDPAIAWSGDAYFVGWNERDADDVSSAHLVRVSADGERLSEELAWSGELAGVTAMGQEVGALFRDNRDTEDTTAPVALRLARFASDGAPLATELVMEDSLLLPLGLPAVWAGDALAFAWTDTQASVYFGRFVCDDFGELTPGAPFTGLTPGPQDLEDAPADEFCMASPPVLALPALEPIVGCDPVPGSDEQAVAGDVVVRHPDELDALAGVTAVLGDLVVDRDDLLPRVDSLSALSALRYVAGDLVIRETRALDLEGLEALEAIGGDLILDSNAELTNVDALSSLGCVGGDVDLRWSSGLTSLRGLSGLSAIPGSLSISRSPLPNLDGLENLGRIGGWLVLSRNLMLESVSALSGLSAIEGGLVLDYDGALATLEGLEGVERLGGLFINNSALENLDVFSQLTVIEGDVRLWDNPLLANVDGLGNVSHVAGSLRVGYEASLSSFGLASLTGVEGDLTFENLPSLLDLDALERLSVVGGSLSVNALQGEGFLTSLEGLRNLTRVGGNVDLTASGPAPACLPSLECVGRSLSVPPSGVDCLDNLWRVGGSLTLSGEELTSLAGLAALRTVGGNLEIAETRELTALDGLETLMRVGGGLGVRANADLANVDALSGLSRVGGGVAILDNGVLASLDGLLGLERVGGGLSVERNASLPTCNAKSLRDAIPTLVGEVSIAENADGLDCAP